MFGTCFACRFLYWPFQKSVGVRSGPGMFALGLVDARAGKFPDSPSRSVPISQNVSVFDFRLSTLLWVVVDFDVHDSCRMRLYWTGRLPVDCALTGRRLDQTVSVYQTLLGLGVI